MGMSDEMFDISLESLWTLTVSGATGSPVGRGAAFGSPLSALCSSGRSPGAAA